MSSTHVEHDRVRTTRHIVGPAPPVPARGTHAGHDRSGGAGGGLLFADDFALTAGWVHYLAFDLFVGTWIARTGIETGVPRLLLLPCLALTFMLGPAGLLAYLLLRLVTGRRATATEATETRA